MAKKIIKAVLPLLAFGLPHRPGQCVEVEDKQAEEIIELAYGVLATEDEVKKYKSDLAKESKGEQKLPKDVKLAVEAERKEKEAALDELENTKIELDAALEANKILTDELNQLKGIGVNGSEELNNPEEGKGADEGKNMNEPKK